jgi:hypothetical protein
MTVPDVHYARNGDVALAYQVVGEGPLDLVYAPPWISNLEIVWENPLCSRFLRRLASFGAAPPHSRPASAWSRPSTTTWPSVR